MSVIKSLDELKAIRDKYKNSIEMRGSVDEANNIRVTVGMATCGIASGSRETINAIVDEVRLLGLNNVSIVQTGCMGYCYAEPVIEIRMPDKEPVLYGNVDSKKAKEIVNKHIKNGEIVTDSVIERSR